jgi:integrase
MKGENIMSKKRGNGEGSISKRKDGRWQASISIGRDPETGKLKRSYIYGKTRKEVGDKLQQELHKLSSGIIIEDSKITVAQWMDQWLEAYKKPSVRPKTYESYEYIIRLHINPIIGLIKLKDLKPITLQNMYNIKYNKGREDGEGGLSARTVRYIHIILHQALKQAVENNLIPRNVSESTTLPMQTAKEIMVMSVEEQTKFLSAIKDERLAAAFMLELATGIRLGELLGLRWSDVDLDKGTIRINQALARIKDFDSNSDCNTKLVFQEPKTAAGKRTIPIPSPVLPIIKQHKWNQNCEKIAAVGSYNDLELVFCSEVGTPIEPRNLVRKFKSLLKKHELINTNFHSLRHTYATRLLESDVPAKVAQVLLGHSSIKMTMDTYSHVLPEIKTEEVKKIDYLFDASFIKEHTQQYSII